jgi:hypothetical protein
MFEKDYIMRSIQHFGGFLTRVLASVSKGNTEEAKTDLQVGAERYFGLRLDLILGMDNDSLLNMLGQQGNLDIEKLYVATQLVRCEANIRAAENSDTAFDLYCRSLGLLLSGFSEMDDSFEGAASLAIDHILDALTGQELPIELSRGLVHYHEYHGRYDTAENHLFGLFDRENGLAPDFGESFYARLIEKPDSDLEGGGLPRDEVSEGLAELRRRHQS